MPTPTTLLIGDFMKFLLLSTLLSTTNVFAFGLNLTENKKVTIEELLELRVDYVQCENAEPRCLLMGKSYGIQYPGQSISDVHLTETVSTNSAFNSIKKT